MRSWGATTIALVASGAANSADLEPAVQLPPALWSWSGGYIGGHVGGGYVRQSFSSPYGPSVYSGGIDSPVFPASGQIGNNWQKNSWLFGLTLGVVSNSANTYPAACGIVLSANGAGRLGYAFGAGPHGGLRQGRRGLAKQSRRRHQQQRVWPMWAAARSTSTKRSTRSFPARATGDAGAQNRERPGQGPTLGAGHHGFARSLLGANRASAEGAIDVFREVLLQVRPGRRMPGQGSPRTVGLLRFSCRTLDHLRTTDPIESVFATGRRRTVRTKGSWSPITTRPRVFKLLIAASRTLAADQGHKSVAQSRRSFRIQRRH